MNKRRFTTRGLVALFLSLILVAVVIAAAGCAPAAKKGKTATFAWTAWMGQFYSLYVVRVLLEDEFGYTTKIEELGVPATWAAMAAGDVDLYEGAWLPNQATLADKYGSDVEDLGTLFGSALQGFIVPSYTADKYGLTSLEDLKDPEVVKALDSDGDGKGDLLGCSAAWACAAINDTILEEAGLSDLYQQLYGEDVFILAAITGALKKGEDVLFYFWTPHELFSDYPYPETVRWLTGTDEQYPPNSQDIVASAKWVAENPEAAEFLRQVKLPIQEMNAGLLEMSKVEKPDDSEFLYGLARKWKAEHQTEINAWKRAARR